MTKNDYVNDDTRLKCEFAFSFGICKGRAKIREAASLPSFDRLPSAARRLQESSSRSASQADEPHSKGKEKIKMGYANVFIGILVVFLLGVYIGYCTSNLVHWLKNARIIHDREGR